MHCPKCHHPDFKPAEPCPRCQFRGTPALVEELAHIEWLLQEMSAWKDGEAPAYQRLAQKYTDRQREVQIRLGLRLPPFTPQQAENAWPDLMQRKALLRKMDEWQRAGCFKPGSTQKMSNEAKQQINELQEQLEGYSEPRYPQTKRQRLDLVNFLLEAVDYLSRNHCFTTSQAQKKIEHPLHSEKETLEIALGLRAKPEPQQTVTRPKVSPEAVAMPEKAGRPPTTAGVTAAVNTASVNTASVNAPPVQPSLPLGERIWRTLLSERTLQVLLFLGIFLFFAAAISFVVWGWRDFSPPLRVAIPTLFTAVFFGLGWYVRTQTRMYRSGIALSAIAGLLVPIDFYTIYINFNVPADYWPFFWFITSIFSLAAYIAGALIIRSRLYGYLVGFAAGSTVLAFIEMMHQAVGLSTDWRSAGLAGVALGLLAVTIALERFQPKRFTYFTESFRFISLLGIIIILIVTLVWRFVERDSYDALHYALSIDWWIGTLIFGWSAFHYRHRGIGILAAIALPVAVYLTQATFFDQIGIDPAWHALGFALLTPLYFLISYALQGYQAEDTIFKKHSHTTLTTGILLLLVTAIWPLVSGNGWAIAGSHLVLAGSIGLSALLWRRPFYFFGTSLFLLTATSAALIVWRGDWSLLSIVWMSLALLHLILALQVGSRFPSPLPNYARPWVISGYLIAGIALIPALLPYNGPILVFALGNWLGVSIWGIYLAYIKQPGFTAKHSRGKLVFHWFTVVAFPCWIWLVLFDANVAAFIIPLATATSAWLLMLIGYRLEKLNVYFSIPWTLASWLVSIIAPLIALVTVPSGLTPAITLLSAGLLYFTDAIVRRQSVELAPAGLVTAGGFILLLSRQNVPLEIIQFAQAGLLAFYICGGVWLEQKQPKIFSGRFLLPLYITSYFLTALLLAQIYFTPLINFIQGEIWTDSMRLWGAAAQLLLGFAYGFYSWAIYKERWAHAAAWFFAAGGGLIALTFSSGQGLSAFTAAVLLTIFILIERGLYRLRQRRAVNRQQAFIRLTWHLYKRPLLITGWVLSAMVIGLALARNLWWLGGGQIQQFWAAMALLWLTGLYAVSARLFRQVRFMWLASILIFIPWTILTHLGWLAGFYATLPGYGLSWMILAWSLFLIYLGLNHLGERAYGFPAQIIAHILVPFSLLWGIADVDTSRFTFGLAIAFYALSAVLDHRHPRFGEGTIAALIKTKFFYPAIALMPIWGIYLLAWLLPAARSEHYGFLFLMFAALGLMAGQWLQRMAPDQKLTKFYGLPGYLTGYISMAIGTLLVAPDPALLALALLYDALLLLVSAMLFKQPIWVYLAGIAAPFSLISALWTTPITGNRYGWWLIGLASIYLALAWLLRRAKLYRFSVAPLTLGLVLTAINLFPSSLDQTGALWGYGGAVVLYAITAFWLRQPLFLIPASALVIVPYSVLLQQSALQTDYYGLGLLPGAVIALGLGWGLDQIFGSPRNFPWNRSNQWPAALTDRLLEWWALSPFTLGLGLALVSPLFSRGAGSLTVNFLLLIPIFGWAIYYFRLRLWLLALGIAGHLAGIFYLELLGWWISPAEAWLRFMPIFLITTVTAIFLELWQKEGSPLAAKRVWRGWSRPLYLLLSIDIVLGQLFSLQGDEAGVIITLTHTLLIAILASLWLSSGISYASLILGVVALVQGLLMFDGPLEGLPLALASLALGYGIIGHGLTIIRRQFEKEGAIPPWIMIWELPFQSFSLGFSLGILLLTFLLGIGVLEWLLRALVGLPYHNLVDPITIQMTVGVLTLLGLLYLINGFVYRRLRLGYVAIGMILSGGLLHIFFIPQWNNTQWYVIPGGIYFLGIAYLEWRQGNKTAGKWLDYLAITLMIGTLFRETLQFGLAFAFLMVTEGFLFIWWGTARRLRRFLYAGTGGVVLATVGQLINSLWSVNQWIVFGVISLLVITTAIVVERKLDDIRAWQELENWE